jgi:glycosyltransferase involved in cell wall biosynthesis
MLSKPVKHERPKSAGPADADLWRQVPAGDQQQLELTILLPCLNEAETLGTCIRKARSFLDESGVLGEIVVADNGSTDGSREIAASLGARVVEVADRGYGAALLGGIDAARGRFIVMGDADDSYDFTRLASFVEQLRNGADLVMGNRFAGGIAPGAMPFLHKYLGNPVLSFLGRLFFRIPVRDFHCGLRAFKADAVRKLGLRSTGMEFASEMVVRSSLAGLTIAEVPTTLKPDGRSRPPHLKTWRDGWRPLKFLLMYSPRWLFFIPGISLILIGVSLAAMLFLGPLRVLRNVVLDIDTFIAACFFTIAGVQLVSFGAISRSYAAISGFLPDKTPFMALIRSATTDRLALGGALFGLLGAGAFGYALKAWAQVDFGLLSDPMIPRMVLSGMTGIVIGMQLLFTGFVLGILEIPTNGKRFPPAASQAFDVVSSNEGHR